MRLARILAAALPLAALLALAVLAAVRGWAAAGDATLDVNGWIALGLAAVVTLALGVGLSLLMLWSARHGRDEPPSGF